MLDEEVLAEIKAKEFANKVQNGESITKDVLVLIRQVWNDAKKYYMRVFNVGER